MAEAIEGAKPSRTIASMINRSRIVAAVIQITAPLTAQGVSQPETALREQGSTKGVSTKASQAPSAEGDGCSMFLGFDASTRMTMEDARLIRVF